MHKLTRGGKPGCLDNYKHGRDNWRSVTPRDKQEIWVELDNMQRGFCAYCESNMDGGRHIEHFRQKGRVPVETFMWANLFGSCNSATSCGRSKDSGLGYSDDHLIKPDIDDPDNYFIFVRDGSIRVRADTEPKGSETLRVFGLNPNFGKLREQRCEAIRRHIATIEYYSELCQQDPLNQLGWLEDLIEELAQIDMEPYSTAIRHAYRAFLPIQI
ncbi:retron Ec78 anti-phage system effector HNH endonuclease PtuB [Pseudomonas oryzihabitans]|uniref:retron Ec78 anti-phage system effector HNH endonuclease PtuB n=1 Tax=Pseudomonas oryzihabitans TaxID=47885 RepID=UPI003CED2887